MIFHFLKFHQTHSREIFCLTDNFSEKMVRGGGRPGVRGTPGTGQRAGTSSTASQGVNHAGQVPEGINLGEFSKIRVHF